MSSVDTSLGALTSLAGLVTSVTASSPLASSGGTTPNISVANGTATGQVLQWNGSAWVRILIPGLVPKIYTVPMVSVVGQLVYQTAVDDVVALTDATNPAKMPAFAFIAQKLSPTTAYLQHTGELGGLTGIVAGSQYWANPASPGNYVTPRPADSPGNVQQQVAIGVDATTIDITIALEPPVYL